jgi:hypothetical protein
VPRWTKACLVVSVVTAPIAGSAAYLAATPEPVEPPVHGSTVVLLAANGYTLLPVTGAPAAGSEVSAGRVPQAADGQAWSLWEAEQGSWLMELNTGTSTGLILDGTADGRLRLFDDKANDKPLTGHRWHWEPAGGGWFRLRAEIQMTKPNEGCLEVDPHLPRPRLTHCSDTENQRWRSTPLP